MISVVIPVYNVEDYLHVCLNSVLNQTYGDLEIICIDDASTDSSFKILEYFSKKDSRIKILKNDVIKGLGYCRNIGLKNSVGKYVFFLDASDWISLNTFEILIQTANELNLDILMFKELFFSDEFNLSIPDSGDYFKDFKYHVFTHFDLNKKKLFNINNNLGNSLYLKSFLDENSISFPNYDLENVHLPFFYEAFVHAKKISFIDEFLYNRRLSNCPIKTSNHMSDEIHMSYLILDSFLENDILYQYYKKEILNFIFIDLLYNNYCEIDENIKETVFDEILLVFKSFIKYYCLYEDIRENISQNVLDYFNVDEIAHDIINNSPLLSVIVPVYNVENYLEECLQSIQNQTFDDIEIICINDGSTDKSFEILKEFAKKDKRFKIIDQTNHGLGYVRNVGIKHAMGEYISFIDSDDYIPKNSLELAYNNLISNDSDLVIFKIARFNDDEFIYDLPGFPLDSLFDNVDFSNFIFNYGNIKNFVLNASFAPWSKIYSKNFLDKFNLRFPIGIAFEDVLFHVSCLLCSSKISFVPEFLYYYRINNQDSITHNSSSVNDILSVCNSVEEYLRRTDHFMEFKLEFIMFKIRQLSQYINLANSEEYYMAVKNEFEEMDISGLEQDIPKDLLDVYYKIISVSFSEFI